MMMRHAAPRRRRLPGAHDDKPFRVFMITVFWTAIVGVALLFVAHWAWGATLLALCAIAFLAGLVLGA
ncbi:MAG: hypothetical protein Tsb0013_23400 [Phycisphaerales bacterium]